jgi:predicted acylesterase/phospholipase RssA
LKGPVAAASPHVPPLAAPEESVPRRSLVLAGGGMRVAYQAGVLLALAEAGLTFAHVDGTSGGTLNLAMLLSGQSPQEMCERWIRLHVRDFASLLPLRDYLLGPRLIALASAAGLVDKVFPQLGIQLARVRSATGLVGTFNVCDFAYKTSEVFEHQRMELPLLTAAISLPILMPPVPWNGRLYVDSAWVRDANLMEGVRRGAEELWLVWCIGNSSRYRLGALNQYIHMLELSANGKLFDELDRISELNQRIGDGEGAGERRAPVRLHVIKPAHPLPLDPAFFSGRVDAATLCASGYRDACEYLESARPEGVPLTPEVTRMQDLAPGISFRQRRRGTLRWADGRSEPALLQVSAEVPGLGAAAAGGAAPRAPLVGMLELPASGRRAFATAGRWQPVRQELQIRVRGEDLALVSEPEPGGGRSPWDLLTAASVTLTRRGGGLAAAGRLRLGVLDVLRFLLGAHAINPASPLDAGRLRLRFLSVTLGAARRARSAPRDSAPHPSR